jgi:chemotaxis protein MotB
MRIAGLCAGALWLAVATGCTTPEQRDQEFRLQKAENRAQTCEKSLADERAKTAALTARLETEKRQSAAATAEAAAQTERAAKLERENQQYAGLIEQRASEPLQRPEVPRSPLPPAVDQALQELATKFQNRMWYEPGRGALSFANDQLFDPGTDVVRADAHAALRELASLIARSLPEQFEVVIVGHTDDTAITREETRAQHATNWHLSVHRAIAVEDVLEKDGVPPARMGVMGYGPYRPAGDDRARNRRVEIFLVRKGEVQGFAPLRPPRR